MDLQQAVQLLTTAIGNNTNDVQALQLALSILNNTYSADLVALDAAKKEADDLSAQLSAEKVKTADLTSQVEALTPLVQQVADLTDQVKTLTDQNTSLSTAVSSVNDAISGVMTTVSDAMGKIAAPMKI